MRRLMTGEANLVVFENKLTSGEPIQYLKIVDDIKSIIWTKKHSDCDTFEIVVPATEENSIVFRTDNLIAINDFKAVTAAEIQNAGAVNLPPGYEGDDVVYHYCDMVGVIEKVSTKAPPRTDGNAVMTISGRSLECVLDRRIVWEEKTWMVYDNVAHPENLFQTLMTSIYELLSDDIICPGYDEKAKKRSISEFNERNIWNILMGDFGDHIESGYRENYLQQLALFEENSKNVYAMELNGNNLLAVVKELCETLGIGIRSYLIADAPGPPIIGHHDYDREYDYLNMGRYKHVYGQSVNHAIEAFDLTIPNFFSWIFIEFYVPVNRSYIGNPDNPYVIFSQNMDNLKDIEYVKDDTNFYNITKVMGDKQEDKKNAKIQYTTVLNAKSIPDGWGRKELFTDASDLTQEKKSKKYIENTYIPALEAEGRKALLEHGRNRNYAFDGTTMVGSEKEIYKLGKDYFVGDFVQFYDDTFAESVQTQVCETVESLDQNGYVMSITYQTPVIDFNIDDPLAYYYYTVDEDNKIITITGIKLNKIMEDGLTDLEIIQNDAYFTTKGVKKTVNKGVETQLVTYNPDEDKKITKSEATAGTHYDQKEDDAARTVIYDGYDIKLAVVYSA